jgi:hypothetical protein
VSQSYGSSLGSKSGDNRAEWRSRRGAGERSMAVGSERVRIRFMIDVVVQDKVAEFRIGPHRFAVTGEECRALAATLTDEFLERLLETGDDWTLSGRWKLELAGPNQRPSDDLRNRVEFHCDGKKWHLVPPEVIALGKSFAAAAAMLE